MNEKALFFGGDPPLVGILSLPLETIDLQGMPVFLFLDAGVIHRVGPNRLYVRMARQLARMGFASLRFDFSGIGDSPMRGDVQPFSRSAVNETLTAMHFLAQSIGSDRFVLLGICSGARIAYWVACRDTRVVGAMLINAIGHLHGTDEALGSYLENRTILRHYRRLAFSKSFGTKNWRKALTGTINYERLLRAARGWRPRVSHRSFLDRAAEGRKSLGNLTKRGVRLLHVYCEGDEGLDYFRLVCSAHIDDADADCEPVVEIIPGANHTLTPLWAQRRLVDLLLGWARHFVSG